MNNDGRKDIVVGDRSGKVFFYSRNEDGTLHFEKTFADVQVNFNSAPAVADWNGDGLLDILTGSQGIYPTYGVVYYYLNNGTPEDPVMGGGGGAILDENNGWIYHYRAQPQVFDLDSDGTQELIVGETDGNFYFHENIGTNSKPVITQGVSIGIQLDGDCRGSFCDWNEDGVWDIVAGDYGKNVHLFLGNGGTVENKNIANKSQAFQKIKLSITKNRIFFDLSKQNSSPGTISIFNSQGKLIESKVISENSISFNKPAAKGLYLAKIQRNSQVQTKQILINQ